MRTLGPVAVLCAACLWVCTSADGDTRTDPKPLIPEKDGVLQLKKSNFNRALRKHHTLLVHFYAPLSGDAQRVSDAFQGAAAALRESAEAAGGSSEVRFGVVDATQEKDLLKELNATMPVVLFLNGDKKTPVHCPIPKNAASILTWLKRRAGSAADLINDIGQWDDSEEMLVVGFFKDTHQDYIQMFHSAAVDLPDTPFSLSHNDDLIKKYDITYDVILLLRKSKLVQAYKVTDETSKDDLLKFITVYQMDLVTEYDGQTASQILTSPVMSHALLFANKSSEDFKTVYTAFHTAARDYRMKILFVLVDVDETRNGRLLEYFRVREADAPVVRLVNLTDQVTYQLPSDSLDTEAVRTFCRKYLDGKAEPKLSSEPIPEDWDQRPVKQLVGMNLEKVAFNPNKTVFVLFYLPYSKESRSLFPLWEELATAYEDREEVVIARIDASANDINLMMQDRYPSLRLFPALYSERVVLYTGKRNVKALMKFVEKEMNKAKKDRVKEEEDRRKYIEAMKEEEAKMKKEEEAKMKNNTKDEL